MISGKTYHAQVVVHEQGLDDAIGIELVAISTDAEGKEHVAKVSPFNVVKREGNLYTFELNLSTDEAGSFKIGCRMYPKRQLLPHRQDFCYVRWI